MRECSAWICPPLATTTTAKNATPQEYPTHTENPPPNPASPLPVATRAGFAAESPPMVLPHKIATLLYCFDADDRLLLLGRTQEPNLGKWSPPGGKVHADRGESPYACACREANEEMKLTLRPSDLHLTGLVSEDGYEGSTHWYIFLFEV